MLSERRDLPDHYWRPFFFLNHLTPHTAQAGVLVFPSCEIEQQDDSSLGSLECLFEMEGVFKEGISSSGPERVGSPCVGIHTLE